MGCGKRASVCRRLGYGGVAIPGPAIELSLTAVLHSLPCLRAAAGIYRKGRLDKPNIWIGRGRSGVGVRASQMCLLIFSEGNCFIMKLFGAV
jgi:hypothetical protein